MTEYKFMHAGNLTRWGYRAGEPKPPRVIGLRLSVGVRGTIVDIPLTDKQALDVIANLAKCITVLEGVEGR